MRWLSVVLVLGATGCTATEPTAPVADAATDSKPRADASKCTLIGCTSGISASVDLPMKPSDFAGAEMRVCFGVACGMGIAPLIAADQGSVPLDGGPCTIALVSTTPGVTKVKVDCVLDVKACVDGSLSLSIQRDLDGGSDAGIDLTYVRHIAFTALSPNGPDCEPHCRVATTGL